MKSNIKNLPLLALTALICACGGSTPNAKIAPTQVAGKDPGCPKGLHMLNSACCDKVGNITEMGTPRCPSAFTPEKPPTGNAGEAARVGFQALESAKSMDSMAAGEKVGSAATAGGLISDNPAAGAVDNGTGDGGGMNLAESDLAKLAGGAGKNAGALGGGGSGASGGGGSGGGGSSGSGVGSVHTAAVATDPQGLGALNGASAATAAGSIYQGGAGASRGSGGKADSDLGSLFGADGNRGGVGPERLNFEGTRDPASLAPTRGSADPEDYFFRLNEKDNLFKVVERRYQKTTMNWTLAAAMRPELPAVKAAKDVRAPAASRPRH